mmetsp:Transcript_40940/g.46511  ORF Transcript_40940/g.46511 Transcript_40940/m.46511 type:complete len:283 (-) Transcript_40940:37-885(-)
MTTKKMRMTTNSSFTRFLDLDEGVMMYIISFVADVPMENIDENIRPSLWGTMTDVLPFVSKQFCKFCQTDYFWQDALKRLCVKEPYLWEEGLLRLLPPSSSIKKMNKKKSNNNNTLVSDVYKALQDTVNYKSLYRRVFETHIRFTGPVFFMTDVIRLGQTFGLHFFEPRYRTLIAEVMRDWPESARQGEAINNTASPTNSFPTFIYAHMAPLIPTTPACLVHVRQCIIHSDGSADVMLEPVAYVQLEQIWERPNSRHLYEATCRRMGLEQSQRLEMDYHREW